MNFFFQIILTIIIIPLFANMRKTLNTYTNNSVNLKTFTCISIVIFIPFLMIAIWPIQVHFEKNVSLSVVYAAFFQDTPFYALIIFIIMFYIIVCTLFNCLLCLFLLKNGTRIKGTIKSSTVINTNNLKLVISWKNPFTGQANETSTIIPDYRKETFDYQYIFADGDQVPIYISSTFHNKYVIDFRY